MGSAGLGPGAGIADRAQVFPARPGDLGVSQHGAGPAPRHGWELALGLCLLPSPQHRAQQGLVMFVE